MMPADNFVPVVTGVCELRFSPRVVHVHGPANWTPVCEHDKCEMPDLACEAAVIHSTSSLVSLLNRAEAPRAAYL